MNSSSTTASPKDWIMIVALSLIWGGSFLFGRILMLEWPPLTVTFFRVGIAAFCLWVFLIISGRKIAFGIQLAGAILLMGIINNVIPFSLILVGQKEIGSGLASVVNAMTPIWTLIIANQLTDDEKITKNKLAGIVFAFIGVVILIGSDLMQGLSASAWAQAAVLGATISYGFAGVFGKRFKKFDPIVISTGQLTASSLVMLPIMFTFENPLSISAPSPEMIVSMLGLSVLCTSVAYILFFKILASAGATNLSLVTFLIPVTAILLGVIWLGESLNAGNIAGMLMIILGLIFVDGRLISRKIRPIS